MASSGSINYNATANEIIKDALNHLSILGVGQEVDADDYTYCLRALNDMVKTWQAQGIHLFKKDEMDIFLKANTQKYLLNQSSGDHATLSSVVTDVKTAASSGATSIDVDSTSGMTANDYIGIEQDDSTVHWTTISSITDSDTLVIASGLTAAAAADNKVYTYTTKANRPLQIHSIRYRDENGIDRELSKKSRQEYFNIPDKDADSDPLYYYYDPQINIGELYVWPVASNLGGYLRATVSKTIEDFDLSTDNPDFPQEWIEVLKYNLAVRVAWAYTKQEVPQTIAALASQLLDGVKSFDTEDSSMYVGPDISDY